MTPGIEMQNPAKLMATANQFAEMMETATCLIEALAPAMGRFGRLCAALDQLGGALKDSPAARTWTLPVHGTTPAQEQPATPAPVAPALASDSVEAPLQWIPAQLHRSGPDSATVVILFAGGAQPVDLERSYQTLAQVPGVEDVISGAYSRDRAAFDVRSSGPAPELALQQALASAVPGAASGEWTAVGEFLVLIGDSTAQAAQADAA